MTGRPHRTETALTIAALLAAAFAGCRQEAGPEVLQQAWKLAAARQVNDALPLVKDYLARHPGDAAGHYVMGRCYLNRPDANTTLAKGEFETALYCFEKNRDLNVLAPGMTADQFQSALHREIALALMRALYEGDSQGVPGQLMYPVLDEALRQVREGLRFDPASGFLQDMERSLEALREGRPLPAPQPEQAARPGKMTI
jgi:hypothetical protein